MRAAPQKDQAVMRSLETSASPLHSLEKGEGLKMELIIDQASVRKIRILWGLESFQVGGQIHTGRGRTLSPRGQRLSGPTQASPWVGLYEGPLSRPLVNR